MLFIYQIKVKKLHICKRESAEKVDILLEFHVHEANLSVNLVDVTEHRQVQFFFDMLPQHVNRLKEKMLIFAYKKQPAGTNILLGKTTERITKDVNFVLENPGWTRYLPQTYYLRNPSGLIGVKLVCEIILIVKDVSSPWVGSYLSHNIPNQPQLMPVRLLRQKPEKEEELQMMEICV